MHGLLCSEKTRGSSPEQEKRRAEESKVFSPTNTYHFSVPVRTLVSKSFRYDSMTKVVLVLLRHKDGNI